jgi:hypothetical protein
MFRTYEHYLGYWAFLADFHTLDEAEKFIDRKKWEHPHREFDIEEL